MKNKLLLRIKREVLRLRADIQANAAESLTSCRKGAKFAFGVWTVGGMTQVAFAGSFDTLTQKITEVLGGVYDAAFGIVSVLAAVCAIIALIMRFTGSQQTAARATQWLVRIGISYALILSLGLLNSVMRATFSSNFVAPATPDTAVASGG